MASGAGDWFSWEGGLGKDAYTKRALIAIVGSFVIGWIPVIGWLAALALAFTLGCSMARRCRDEALSPWLGVLAVIPVVGWIFAVYLIIR